ncbi:IS1380 family transposase, partial [Ereboglobus sp. PH5-10]|uniref:IS1380 family transposase n=1 Tax=Ereboglobus sp. PH5-10 TaxID=2940629 RepID=UPI0024075406
MRSTPRPVTPFGGLAVLVEFWRQLDLPGAVRSLLPFDYTSPNSHGPLNILLAFWLGVAAGARRFAHVNLLRSDVALRELLGWKRWPGEDATRAFFGRFGWKQIDAFFPALNAWLLAKLKRQGVTLDLDSTVFERYGRQEGAKKGYNPRRPGRASHHPLLAVLAEPAFVLHGWLRSGNTTAGRGVMAFLTEALLLLPEGWRLRCLRADSGFFDQALLGFLEARELCYIVVARMTKSIKLHCAGVREWRELDENYAVGEFRTALQGWAGERRFIVVRERVRENKRAVGRKLIDVPGYTHRVFVTNRNDAPEALWRDYNQRARIEQRICELKD